MDVYLTKGAARNAVCRVLGSMGVLFVLLWAISTHAAYASTGRDYLLPGEAIGGYISTPSSIESGMAPDKLQSTINYQAFDGSTHQLLENRGRYVNVLIPQSYDGGEFFTADHLEELVDKLDMLYVLYSELMHDEPAGSGLVNIAFIPQTCGMGCGLVGARGFEVLSDPRNYEAIIHELDAGRLEPVLLHEMAHNFDTHSAYLHYLPDHAHAWTDIFEFFAPFRYARMSSNDETPDDRYNSPVSAAWKEYLGHAEADWQSCVVNDSCADMGLTANNLWAMLYYRIEAVHGIDAILDSFVFLKDYAATHAAPVSALEKESLRILSLAHGAGANIGCYMDALKWPVQPGLRSELNQLFGSSNTVCADSDGDGYSAIAGDCNDNDASKNMSMPENGVNGQDDDCDDLVDEIHLVEAEAGSSADNFDSPVQTSLPFEVQGSGANASDRDSFRFSLPPSGRIRATLCASGAFRGWMTATLADGSFLDAYNYYSYQPAPGCTSNTFDFGEATSAGLLVMPDNTSGDYTLAVTAAEELLPDHSALVQIRPHPAGGMELLFTDSNGMLAELGTDEIEIWISGAGIQFFRPFDQALSVRLDATTTPALRNGETYQVRIRPRANGLPLAAFSAGHLFRYDRAAAALPAVDHRFSGAWFDAEHSGEGYIVEVLQDNHAVVYWFTYAEDGSQRWLLGLGDVSNNSITVEQLMDTHGGRFGANFNPADVVFENAGSLTLSFLDCATALANYSVDNNGGHQSTARLTNIYGHNCAEQTPAPNLDISGSWYDPTHSGEGYIIQQISYNEAVVFWFTYDEQGQQSWMFNTGTINNGQIQIPNLVQPRGGHFGRSFNPATIEHHEWGELTLNLNCNNGTANYTTQMQGYTNGSQALVPLTRLGESGCVD